MRWLVDRKKREVANLLIELNSNKSYDFQNYRRMDSQLFQHSLLFMWSIRGKCYNERCCNCRRISVTPRHLVTGNKMTWDILLLSDLSYYVELYLKPVSLFMGNSKANIW